MNEEVAHKSYIHTVSAERKRWSILLVEKGVIKEAEEDEMLVLNPGRLVGVPSYIRKWGEGVREGQRGHSEEKGKNDSQIMKSVHRSL